MCLKLNNLRVVMIILCLVPEVNICFCFLLKSLLLSGFKWLQNTSKLEYTNIICTSLDTNFSTFDYCYIKPINRTYKYISFGERSVSSWADPGANRKQSGEKSHGRVLPSRTFGKRNRNWRGKSRNATE